MGRRNTEIKLVMVAFLALAVRIVYLYQADASPLFDAPMVDARTHVENALKLAGGAWEGNPEPFWQPPLYPYFLAITFALFGENYYLPRLVQAAVGAAVCALLFLLGRRAFSPSVGWLAAGMAALYGPFIYFEGEFLPVGLATFFNVGLLLVLLWAARGGGPGRWLLAGLLLGLSGLTVANVFLFAPVVLLWAILFPPTASQPREAKNGLSRRALTHPRLFRLAGFVLGIALVVAPVTLRNRIVGGEWVLVSHNAGVNFFIGNNPDYDKTVGIRPGRAWFALVNLPEEEAGITEKAAQSRYFFTQSWKFVANDPSGYLRLMLRKAYLFWRGDEIRRNLDPYYARTYSWALGILLWKHGLAFPFGLISSLSLLGMGYFLASPFRRTPAGSLMLLFTATYAFSVVLFFITGRYRLPVVPCLLLFAAYGILSLLQQRGRRLALALAALFVLLIGANAGTGSMDVEGDAYQHYWMGVAYKDKGMKANALRECLHAVKLDPSHEGALVGLAALYTEQKRYDEAIRTAQRLIHYYPDRTDVRLKLADLSLLKADYQQAIDFYQDFIPHRPDWASLYGRLAYAYLMADAPDQAITAYEKTLSLNPDSLLVRFQLAQLYEAQEQTDQAIREYTRLLEQRPDHVDALCRLADLLSGLGNDSEAEIYLEKALSVDPRSIHALWSLGRLKTRQGDFQAAVQRFLELVELDPDDYPAHRQLGQLYLKTGQNEQAQAEFELYERGMRLQRSQKIGEE